LLNILFFTAFEQGGVGNWPGNVLYAVKVLKQGLLSVTPTLKLKEPGRQTYRG